MTAVLPDPGRAGTLDEVAEGLRRLKVWAGDPSYDTIKDRINEAWRAAGRPGGELARKATVADCFKAGRRRMNTDLVIAVVQALHPDVGYVTQWRQALRVIGGEAHASAQVRVQDTLPPDLPGFAGRDAELRRLRRGGDAPGGVLAIAGMAGVGKTGLAIRFGHRLAREKPFDHVLFVNLRGFNLDPAQPPVDPGAVLDGFLRLLGTPAQQIPFDVDARRATLRSRLGGRRTLMVLDNAASAGQIGPLLPDTPGCVVLVTSRRSVAELRPAIQLTMDVFSPAEAERFLIRSTPGVPTGPDRDAVARIARRCGCLPLALGLVAGHIRSAPGWTLTDHADRLDERHRDRRLDSGVQLAFDRSYQHLAASQQRVLRLAALHPGQDLDLYAAAALAETDLDTARAALDDLGRNHLVQRSGPGRWTFHDLIRVYAADRARDQDPPRALRAAMTRMLDHYLAVSAAAVDTLYPAEAGQRPRVPRPRGPSPDVGHPDAARAWLDAERSTLVAVAGHGRTSHLVRLSTTLYRYLDGGHPHDALLLHAQAQSRARDTGDTVGEGHAFLGLGTAHLRLGRYEPAAEHLRTALELFRTADDPAGQARVLGNLGNIEKRRGRFAAATDCHEQALTLFRRAGDRAGEARSLVNLGVVETRQGHYPAATDHLWQALDLCRRAGDPVGEADAQATLGYVEAQLGHHRAAADYCEQAIAGYRKLGDRGAEAAVMDDLGTAYTRLGEPARGAECHRHTLAVVRESGDRDAEAWALNGLGEAAQAGGDPAGAIIHHRAAGVIAVDIGSRDQQARAEAGLGEAFRSLSRPADARIHYRAALRIYTELGMPAADRIRERLVEEAAR
ncbi:ATP-binding protein [Actinoplanes sp. HUAS TT8]|uniref:ATP-binding protein n=1 Tax=Actinoplanes sp. HUAS TT8 TaxID=3447453 RepID=UPI003F51BE4C